MSENPSLPDEAVTKSHGRGLLIFARDLLVIVVVAFAVSFIVKTFFIRSFYIPSSSMKQTLQINDRILVNQVKPNIGGIERGDVVVFRDPGGWLEAQPVPVPNAFEWVLQEMGLLPSSSDDFLIKRVIGVEGDRVSCCNASGQVEVNGVPLDEPYIFLPPGSSAASGLAFDVTVPPDSYWVMGDNRYGSKDSRYNTDNPGGGFVPAKNIVGNAFVINWPIARWAWLSNYPETFAGVEDAQSK